MSYRPKSTKSTRHGFEVGGSQRRERSRKGKGRKEKDLKGMKGRNTFHEINFCHRGKTADEIDLPGGMARVESDPGGLLYWR